MRKVFADTFYWAAIINPRDQWHVSALAAQAEIGNDVRIVTTEAVLTEVLNYFSEFGAEMRKKVVDDVRDIMIDADIEYVEHSPLYFYDALDLYENRLDKGYSLTDCVSMLVMKSLKIHEVLTHDDHFEQEGFIRLL